MLTSLCLRRVAALNRGSGNSPISLALFLTAGDRTPGASSSYSSVSHAAQESSLLLSRNNNHTICGPSIAIAQQFGHHSLCSPTARACFSSKAAKKSAAPTEIVVDLYQKMLKSVDETRSMPPNADLWSLVENCSNHEDIKLMFQILQRLRIFRLSNLRIHENFNCHLCMRVTKACTRANAPEHGLKALWKHNVYGLTPSIASAHYLLLYAKEKNNANLMVKIMKVMKKNSLPLQPGTADIVFSICYTTDNWSLMKKYARRFLEAGVKLHRTAFGIWMEFAAKRGDAESIWKIEKLRSEAVTKHTLASGFSLAKGYIIERNPESAAAAINLMYQDLTDKKKALVAEELQKLAAEWPKQVIKGQKKEDQEALAEALKSDISAMVASLLNMGIDAKLNVEEL